MMSVERMRVCVLALLTFVCASTVLSQSRAGYKQGEVIVLMKQGEAADSMVSRARSVASSSSHRLRRLPLSSFSHSLSRMTRVMDQLDAFELVPLDQPSVGALARKKDKSFMPLLQPTELTELENDLLSRLFLLRYHSTEVDAAEAADMLLATGEVERAEPNLLVRIAATDSITQVTADRFDEQWWMHKIRLPELWQQPIIKDLRVKIAIIDTGVDTHHPDLEGNVSDDGYDFPRDTTDIVDFHGHGTHCAGIAAANGHGQLAGACPEALILPITVMDKQGMGSMFDVLLGVVYALRHGSHFISMSLGSYGESALYRSIMETATSHSIVFAAAGNEGFCFKPEHRDLHGVAAPHQQCIPGAFPGVIAVMCTNEGGQLCSYSNFDCDGPLRADSTSGPNYELRAPGDKILSTLPDGKYGYMSGTSMSCPLAAGAVASLCLRGRWPGGVPQLLRTLIMTQSAQLDMMAALKATTEQLEVATFEYQTDSVTYFFQRLDSATVRLGDGINTSLTIHRPSLTTLTIPDEVRGLAVTSLSPHAFDGCSQIQTVHLGRNIAYIGGEAFTGCTSLADVYAVTDIPPICIPNGFSTEQLRTVRLNIVHGFTAPYASASVWGSFQHRRELDLVTGNRFQGVVTLRDMSSVLHPTERQIPAAYIIYNKESRIGQVGAGELAIDNRSSGVLVIPDEVTIPSSPNTPSLRIMVIDDEAFTGCEELTEVRFPSLLQLIESSAFNGCKALRNVELPEYVSYIGSRAFAGCESLRTLTLSPNLSTIGGFAFVGCTHLQQIVAPMMEPPSLPENAFITQFPTATNPFNLETMGDIYEHARLIVPYGCRDLYASTSGWELFKHIEEMSSVGTQSPLITHHSPSIYSLTGQRFFLPSLSSRNTQQPSLNGLPPGIYVVDGRKVVVK